MGGSRRMMHSNIKSRKKRFYSKSNRWTKKVTNSSVEFAESDASGNGQESLLASTSATTATTDIHKIAGV